MNYLFDILTLKLVRFIARVVGNLHTNFDVSWTLPSPRIGQHLSNGHRDLSTFDLVL